MFGSNSQTFQAFNSICDLLITFSEQLSLDNGALKDLEYVASANQQQALNDFVQNNVFSTQQEGKLKSKFYVICRSAVYKL